MGYKYGYRPITHLTFAIEHEFFGEDPQISHAINVLFYALLSLFIYYLVRSLAPTRGPTFALIVALLFAAHPIHTEVVASIKNRDEILSLLFAVLGMQAVFFLKKERGAFIQVLMWLGIFGLFLLSLYSKASNLGLILLIPVIYILFVKREWSPMPILFAMLSTAVAALFLLNSYQQIFVAVIASMLAVLLTYLLFKENRTQFLVAVRKLKSSTHIDVFILLGAWVIITIAAVYENPILLLVYFILATINIVWVLDKKWAHIVLFAHACGLILASYVNLNFDLFWLYWIFYLYWVFNTERKHKVWTALIVLLTLAASLSVGDYNGLSVVATFFVFISPKKWRRLIFPFFLGTLAVLNINVPLHLFVYLLSLGIALVHFDWLKIPESFKTRFSRSLVLKGVLVFVMFSIAVEGYINSEDDVMMKGGAARVKRYAEVEQGLIDTQQAETTVSLLDNLDRPLEFVENPIIDHWDLAHRSALAVNTNRFYLVKQLNPFPRLYYYGYNQFELHDWKDWQTILSLLLVLAVLMTLVYALLAKQYLLFFALLFLELGLLPYLNFFTPVAGIVGDRLMFASTAGFSIGLGLVLWWLKAVISEKGVYAAFVLSVFAMGVSVVLRNEQWENPITLFSKDIDQLSNSAVAHSMFGEELLNKAGAIQDLESEERKVLLSQSIENFQEATAIYDGFHNDFYHMGIAHYMQGNFFEAQDAFVQSYTIDSAYLSFPYLHMAEWAVNLHYDSVAIYDYSNYLKLEPYDEYAYFDLLEVLLNNKMNNVAANVLETMLLYFPNHVLVYYNLYEIYRGLGMEEQAVFYLEKGKEIDSFLMESYLME